MTAECNAFMASAGGYSHHFAFSRIHGWHHNAINAANTLSTLRPASVASRHWTHFIYEIHVPSPSWRLEGAWRWHHLKCTNLIANACQGTAISRRRYIDEHLHTTYARLLLVRCLNDRLWWSEARSQASTQYFTLEYRSAHGINESLRWKRHVNESFHHHVCEAEFYYRHAHSDYRYWRWKYQCTEQLYMTTASLSLPHY